MGERGGDSILGKRRGVDKDAHDELKTGPATKELERQSRINTFEDMQVLNKCTSLAHFLRRLLGDVF